MEKWGYSNEWHNVQQGTLHPSPKQHHTKWGRCQKLIQSGSDQNCFSLIKWKNIYMALNFTVLHIWQHLKPIFVVILEFFYPRFLSTLLNGAWWLNWQITGIFLWQFTKVYIFSSQRCSLWKLLLLGVKSRLSYKIECNEQTLSAFYNHSPRSPRSSMFSYPVPSASRECRGKVDKGSWEDILTGSHG